LLCKASDKRKSRNTEQVSTYLDSEWSNFNIWWVRTLHCAPKKAIALT
jgi:hypothetical protein